MNTIFTIAAGVALGLLLTAALLGVGLFVYRTAGSNAGRQKLIFASIAAGLTVSVSLLGWFASTLILSTYRQYQREQHFARQAQHTRDWCASFKHTVIAKYTSPNKNQREAWFENPSSDTSFPFEIGKGHPGVLHDGSTGGGISQLRPAGQLATCQYLGVVSQSDVEAAVAERIRNQQFYDQAQKKKCSEMTSASPAECIGYGPSLDTLFRSDK